MPALPATLPPGVTPELAEYILAHPEANIALYRVLTRPPPFVMPPGASELVVIAGTAPVAGGSDGDIGLVDRGSLSGFGDSQQASAMQLMCAAAGAPIGFGYGRVRVGLMVLAPVLSYDGELLIPGFVAQGPIDAIEGVDCDNAPLQSGVTLTTYTGTLTQTADDALYHAWLQNGHNYADALAGIAYAITKTPADPANRIGNYVATARLLKVYDPRKDSTNGGSGAHRLATPTTWEYSTNPVLALAHFITTAGFGAVETMDWSTVIACADICDETLTVGGVTQKRRELGVMFTDQSPIGQIEDALRSYAGVFIDRDGPTVRLIPDAPGSPVYDFTNASPSNYLRDSITKMRRGRDNAPTVVTVRWTDTSVMPWATQEATAKLAGVDAGTVPYVESVVEWHGCQSAGMAMREAIRRLNEFNLADLTITLVAFDDAVRVRKGDIVTVTDERGLDHKPMRVTAIVPAQATPGRYAVTMTEYQEGVYSDDIYTGVVVPDSGLPSPATPPTPGALTLLEEVFQERGNGRYASRVKVTFPASTWPFVLNYQLTVTDAGAVIETAIVPRGASPEYRTGALQEGRTYSFALAIVSTTGAASATPATADLAVQGSKLPPGDVPWLNGFALGGELLLFWGSAIDIDLTGYEVRVGPTTATWDTAATYVDRLDALSTRVRGLAAATWRVFIKARDSIRSALYPYGQYSVNAVSRDITIDADAGAFLLANFQYTTPTLTNMVAQPREGLTTAYVTDPADVVFGTLFPSNVGTYGNPLATYHTSGTSRLLTESHDFGSIITGNFSATIDYTDISGTAQPYIEISDNGSAWNRYDGLATKQSGRYVRIGIETLTTGTMIVRGLPAIRLDAIGRTESSGGTVTSDAGAATTITLAGKYNKLISLSIIVEGTTGRYATYNNVVLSPTGTNSFDVYVFNSAGTQIAAPFRWSIVGI